MYQQTYNGMPFRTQKYPKEPVHFSLVGNDGSIRFPSVFVNKDLQAAASITVPYGKELLNRFYSFIQRLPLSARTSQGQLHPLDKIDHTTLFVNPLVKIAQKQSTLKDPYNLGPLYTLATQLQIKPLINLFAFFLAHQISPLSTSLHAALQPFQLDFEKVSIEQIEKHLLLKDIGITELCISDYLGLYGQPIVDKGTLDLSREGLTSLDGIELIEQPNNVTEIILDHNHILSIPSPNLTTLLSSFPNVKKMSFRGNRPSQLPLHSFHNLEDIHIIL